MTRLEVLVKGEVTTDSGGQTLSSLALLLLCAVHDTSLLVIANSLLEEVGLASQRDVFHEVEGVGGVVDLGLTEGEEKTVGDKLNVLAHKLCVHAKESTGKGI